MASRSLIPRTVPLVRVPLDLSLAPERVLLALRDEPWPFALVGRWAGGGAIVGCAPTTLLAPGEDPFTRLEDLPEPTGDAVVGGGWFGWLGYGLGALVERIPPRPPRPVPLPDAHLAFYDHVLRLDEDGQWWFESLTGDTAPLDRLLTLLAAAPEPRGPDPATFTVPGGHVAAVADCVERIAAGRDLPGQPVPAARGGVGRGRGGAVRRRRSGAHAGLRGVLRHALGRRREPLAGAVPAPRRPPRHDRPDQGHRARARGAPRLREGPRRARDDRRPHAQRPGPGRRVRSACTRRSAPSLQPHSGVWHLVSDVTATLAPEHGDAALLRATFPPGSVTGAPKVQALHVISELESTGREVYTGAIGYASPHAGLELNVAIRTFEARAGRLWLGAGGGIVADSDPHAELEECLVKARPLISAIGGTLSEPNGNVNGSDPFIFPAPLVKGRPDPASGRVRDAPGAREPRSPPRAAAALGARAVRRGAAGDRGAGLRRGGADRLRARAAGDGHDARVHAAAAADRAHAGHAARRAWARTSGAIGSRWATRCCSTATARSSKRRGRAC